MLRYSNLTVLAFALTWSSIVQAQEKIVGSVDYLNSCAGCHGTDGRGGGPIAPYLTVKPSDLTRLSERNNGQFPFLNVFMIIDGRTTVRSHSTSAMPIWGDRYQQQVDPKQGNPYGAEQAVRGRILELVNYLEAIQADAKKDRLIR